ncbi:lipase family alpha/beta hydrolase [Virgibacillus salexigens]|uniref:PGAP1-like protein n=1 Tax=Virgibacillus massiliensis TaxID=1462526 RepID=A0A024Q9G5_9BACI|nr:hypothetical protein [Virgibacillus massiliensis]CDQ38855.1 hypothetical protein BN990_01131 [Virgibacillus massiliensis]
MTIRIVVMLLFSLIVLSIPCYVIAQSKGLANPRLVGKGEENVLMGKGGNGNEETPGDWYVGQAPVNPVENAPILLFVPGLNNVAQIFWEEEDGLYHAAYEAGYQTAFVQLYDAGGASADMWDNGMLLAEKIEEISAHFNGRPITLVAYSKGGVDAQTAAAYYGAWRYVDNIITLSSPHHGSQLADLANSNWAGWLADLLGFQGEGTTAVETGRMTHFRSEIDEQPYAYYNDYYTFGGMDWGSVLSVTWYGGVYLSSYGENDGVVTAVSSSLPEGQEIAIGEWDHLSIKTEIIFPFMDDYIMDEQVAVRPELTKAVKPTSAPVSNQLIRGNAITKGNPEQQELVVEDGVESIDLLVYAGHNLKDLTLIDPTGRSYSAKKVTTHDTGGIFYGAKSYRIAVKNPPEGNWKVKLSSNQDSAYLLVTKFDKQKDLPLIKKISEKSKPSTFNYQIQADSAQVKQDSLQATYTVLESGNRSTANTWKKSGTLDFSSELSNLKKNQSYNITIDVKGETRSGFPFERTLIDSIYTAD